MKFKQVIITVAFFVAPWVFLATLFHVVAGFDPIAFATSFFNGVDWSEIGGALFLMGLFFIGACIGNIAQVKKEREMRRQEELRRIELERQLAQQELERQKEAEYQRMVAYNQMISTPKH